MRRKKNLERRLDQTSALLLGRLFYGGEFNDNKPLCFREIFGNDAPVFLEIGSGKGGFAIQTARDNPDINIIALEKCENVVVTALEQAGSQPNLRFIIGIAEELPRIITSGSISGIWLNFSCPYPKKYQQNRRLTNKRFLRIYNQLLSSDAVVKQKTDNEGFFQYSRESFAENNWDIIRESVDFKSEDENEAVTEYERKFRGEGKPIYRIVAKWGGRD
jgi:tRNA (guanine-N7-)-methyltransferase